MRTREEQHEYFHQYYIENKEYFRWYRQNYYKKHHLSINSRRRARYANDAEYRQHELDRKRDYLKRKKESK